MIFPQVARTLLTLVVNSGQLFPSSLHKRPGVYFKARDLVRSPTFLIWLMTFPVLALKVWHVRNILKPKWFPQDCPSFNWQSHVPEDFVQMANGDYCCLQDGGMWLQLYSSDDEWRVYSGKIRWEDTMSISIGDEGCLSCGIQSTQSGCIPKKYSRKNAQKLLKKSEAFSNFILFSTSASSVTNIYILAVYFLVSSDLLIT